MAVALLRAMLDKNVSMPPILKAFPEYDGAGLPRDERLHASARGEE